MNHVGTHTQHAIPFILYAVLLHFNLSCSPAPTPLDSLQPLLQQGHYDSARDALKTWLETHPNDPLTRHLIVFTQIAQSNGPGPWTDTCFLLRPGIRPPRTRASMLVDTRDPWQVALRLNSGNGLEGSSSADFHDVLARAVDYGWRQHSFPPALKADRLPFAFCQVLTGDTSAMSELTSSLDSPQTRDQAVAFLLLLGEQASVSPTKNPPAPTVKTPGGVTSPYAPDRSARLEGSDHITPTAPAISTRSLETTGQRSEIRPPGAEPRAPEVPSIHPEVGGRWSSASWLLSALRISPPLQDAQSLSPGRLAPEVLEEEDVRSRRFEPYYRAGLLETTHHYGPAIQLSHHRDERQLRAAGKPGQQPPLDDRLLIRDAWVSGSPVLFATAILPDPKASAEAPTLLSAPPVFSTRAWKWDQDKWSALTIGGKKALEGAEEVVLRVDDSESDISLQPEQVALSFARAPGKVLKTWTDKCGAEWQESRQAVRPPWVVYQLRGYDLMVSERLLPESQDHIHRWWRKIKRRNDTLVYKIRDCV